MLRTHFSGLSGGVALEFIPGQCSPTSRIFGVTPGKQPPEPPKIEKCGERLESSSPEPTPVACLASVLCRARFPYREPPGKLRQGMRGSTEMKGMGKLRQTEPGQQATEPASGDQIHSEPSKRTGQIHRPISGSSPYPLYLAGSPRWWTGGGEHRKWPRGDPTQIGICLAGG